MAKTVHVCLGGSGAHTLEDVLKDRPDHRMVVVHEGFGLGPLSDIDQPAGMAARAAWWNHMRKAAHRDQWAPDFADHVGLTDLAQAPDPDEIAMVWCGANADEQILLRAVCHAAGGELNQIVKVTIFLTDLGNFAEVNAVMAAEFGEPYPARSTVQVSALPRGAAIEIEAIMVPRA